MLHTCVCTHAHIHIGDRGQLAKRFSPSSMWVLQVEFMLSVLAVSTFTWWAVSPAQISIFLMLVDFLFHAFRVSLKGMGVLREDRLIPQGGIWLSDYFISLALKENVSTNSTPIQYQWEVLKRKSLGLGSSPALSCLWIHTQKEQTDASLIRTLMGLYCYLLMVQCFWASSTGWRETEVCVTLNILVSSLEIDWAAGNPSAVPSGWETQQNLPFKFSSGSLNLKLDLLLWFPQSFLM